MHNAKQMYLLHRLNGDANVLTNLGLSKDKK